MGRKNWLFSNTPAGAQSSAVIYSLIETAKENDLDPYRYLVWLLHNAPEQSQKDEDWPEFFPPCECTEGMQKLKSNGIPDRHLKAWPLRWRPFLYARRFDGYLISIPTSIKT